MRILFLSRWFPVPADNGAKLRVSGLLKELARNHTVDLIAFREDSAPESAAELRDVCRSVQTFPLIPFRPNTVRAIASYLRAEPRSVWATHSQEMQSAIAASCQRNRPNLIVASQIDMVPYALHAEGNARMLEELEVAAIQENGVDATKFLERTRTRLTREKHAHYIRGFLQGFDGFTVVSERELRLVQGIAPDYGGISAVIPNGVASHTILDDAQSEADTLIYSGSVTYGPNLDAVYFFAKEILPLVRARRPMTRLLVTGRTDGVDLSELRTIPGVEFTGLLPDIRSALERSRVVVVPLRAGGGTRIKILEAMGYGKAVVATSKGIEGLDLCPGNDLLVADTAQDFANAVLDLLEQENLRCQLGRNGYESVKKYEWSEIGRRLDNYICEIVSRRSAAGKTVR